MQHIQSSRWLLTFCLLTTLTLTWLPAKTLQASPSESDGTPLYAFGLHLFRLGEYYRATTELKRFSLLFPHHQRFPAAQILIGLALQEDGLELDALMHFQRLRQIEDTDVARIAAFKLGELQFFQRQYQAAIEHFQQFLQNFPDGPLVFHTRYLLGLSWALNGQPEQAASLLQTFPSQHEWSPQAYALEQALHTPPPEPSTSPRTAGILAGILPGAGHLYLGKPAQALTAFLLNGLFISGAVFAFQEGLEATGAILLYFETGWYLGNIKSAVAGARNANQQQRQAYADHLRATYAPPRLRLPHLEAPSLGFHLTF